MTIESQQTPSTQKGDLPHWELATDETGNLVATLTGSYPPLTVTAPNLKTLRKQIRVTIIRAML